MLRCGISTQPMTPWGQNENPPFAGLCQLPPAADMRSARLICEKCHNPTFAHARSRGVRQAVVTDDDLRAVCREHLAPYKVPVAFHRIEALPRSEVGKVLRRNLTELLSARANT